MANFAVTADRRNFLSVGAAIAAAVSIPAIAKANARAAWEAAMAELDAANTEYDRYTKFAHIPESLRERVADTYRNAMKMPAPDRAALRWKLRELLDDGEESQILADIARHLGDE